MYSHSVSNLSTVRLRQPSNIMEVAPSTRNDSARATYLQLDLAQTIRELFNHNKGKAL